MIRYLTSGESHGPSLTAIVEGVPAGLEISEEFIAKQLARRQKGYGRGGRMAWEKDKATISSGVRHGLTMGSPIALSLPNRAFKKDKANWPVVMSKDPVEEKIERITLARPGHADLVGTQKFRFDDIRPVIERSSARETAARVAATALSRRLLEHFGIYVGGHVIQLGSVGFKNWDEVRAHTDSIITQKNALEISEIADKSEVRCLNADLTEQMVEEIKQVRKDGYSLGGHYEIIVSGVPAGLGSYVHWDKKLDGKIAQAVMGTQAMKGVEIGYGFEAGRQTGNLVHDEITYNSENDKFDRATNRAGGIEGGMSTGQPIIIRGCMKPIPTMLKALGTVDLDSKKPTETRYERSDVCALPRAVVVVENVIADVIANAFLEKFGGDSIAEIEERYEAAQ
jgi:chorismate synthase